jgi:hypothetical protein
MCKYDVELPEKCPVLGEAKERKKGERGRKSEERLQNLPPVLPTQLS